MEPEIANGSVLYFFPLMGEEPERFDVVIFQPPYDERPWVKRVCGLPGETIEVRDSVLLVNGSALEQPNETFGVTEPFGPVVIPEHCVFVMGDHRDGSTDSRVFGPIYIETIKGKVWYCTDRVSYEENTHYHDCILNSYALED